MERRFRVAFFGPKPSRYFPTDLIIRTYDLNVEQILDIVENMDDKGLGGDDKALGMFKPLQESTMITGGRGFYPNKRHLRRISPQDIEVLIITADSSYGYESKIFLRNLKLSSTCTVQVLRKPFIYNEHDQFDITHGRYKTADWLEEVGKGRKKDKKFDRKTVIIGHPYYEATDPAYGLPELRSILTQVELTDTITKPIKETVSAGQSLLGIGQRFGGWMKSLFSGN